MPSTSPCPSKGESQKALLHAPWSVWRDSAFAAFIVCCFFFYGLGIVDLRIDSPLIHALSIAGLASILVILHGQSEDWWQALCRPFQRLDRIHQEKDRAREAREALAALDARLEEEREQERRLRLHLLTREWNPDEFGNERGDKQPKGRTHE